MKVSTMPSIPHASFGLLHSVVLLVLLGITAGASAPEVLVQAVVERLRSLGGDAVRPLEGAVERVTFPLPKGLQQNPQPSAQS